MPRYLSTTVMLLAVVCNFSEVAGADPAMLEEIVIKGEKEPANQEILTIKEVKESPAKDMGEAVKQLEGIDIVRKGAIANDIVLRGLQKENINVLMDGAKVYGACPSRMDPPAFHFDFAEAEEIQVLKGPYDLENPGSMGGKIDIRSKRAFKGFASDLDITYGSYNAVNGSATASYGSERYDALAGYAYKRSDVPKSGNGRLITDIYPATSANRYRPDTLDSKAYEINTGWAKLGLNPAANARLVLNYSYQDAEHVLYPYLKMDADYDKTHLLNLSYGVEKVSPLVRELQLQLYWDQVSHLMDDRLRVSSAPSMMVNRYYSMQTDAATQGIGFKAHGALAIGPGTMKGGIDYLNRNWNAVNRRAMYQSYTPVSMIPDVYVDNLGMFGEYELPLGDRVRLKGGIRGDLTWVEAEKVNTATSVSAATDFADVSANLQLTCKPVEKVELFLGMGRGYRTPAPDELFIDVPAMAPSITWRGNPGLRPTISHEADLGVKLASDRFYLNASLFYNDLSDYVALVQASTTLKSYQNVDASIWGAEVGSQLSLPLDLFLRGALSYNEGWNKDGGRPLAEMPPLRGMVALRYDNGVFFAEVAENLAREQDRVDSALNEQPTAGWATTDIRGGYNYRGLSVYAGIYNLLDKQYYSHLSYLRDPFASGVGVRVPENGRNFYVTVAYRF